LAAGGVTFFEVSDVFAINSTFLTCCAEARY
jgi:hypothetical protein